METAMESIAEATAAATAMPRFEDGAINLQELMRRLAEDVANAIMAAEAEQLCAETSVGLVISDAHKGLELQWIAGARDGDASRFAVRAPSRACARCGHSMRHRRIEPS